MIFAGLLAAAPEDKVGEWAVTWANDLNACSYRPLHDWFRASLEDVDNPTVAQTLLMGVTGSWRGPEDLEVMKKFGASGSVPEGVRYFGLRSAVDQLSDVDRADLFFHLFEGGTIPGRFGAEEVSRLPWLTAPDLWVDRAVPAVLANPDHPLAPVLLGELASHAMRRNDGDGFAAMSLGRARSVQQALEAVADRPRYSVMVQQLPALRRRTGGGDALPLVS